MPIGCFAGFVIDMNKILLIGSSLLFAVVILLILKGFRLSTKAKIGFIYLHLISLFFPFVLLTTEAGCGLACMPCGNSLASLAVLALPTTLVFSTIASFFVIPGFYMFFNRRAETENGHIIKFTKKHSRRMSMKMPKIYIFDDAKPVAFSFKSFKLMMFLSVGLIDILSKKELEAVILHELGHLKRKASVLTTSVSLVRFFSPLSLVLRFNHDSGKEEVYADRFAVRVQGTDKYLRSAKRKMDEFEKENRLLSSKLA